MRLARLGRDLVALRSRTAAEVLQPGQLLSIGQDARAAVLCARGGTFLAYLLPEQPGGALPSVPEGATVAPLTGELLRAPFGSSRALGGRVVDCFGGALDGGANVTLSPMVPLFAPAPTQADLRPIDSSLHTGTLAIDALTPVGRGQSMMLFGEAGTGKSSLALDACLAQAAASDVHCVLALSDGGAERACRMLAHLEQFGGHELRERSTIVAAVRCARPELPPEASQRPAHPVVRPARALLTTAARLSSSAGVRLSSGAASRPRRRRRCR